MTTLTAPAEVDVAAALAQLGGRVDAVEARTLDPVAPAEPRPALASVIGQALQDFAGRPRTTAALADVVGGGNGGLLPPQWSSELVGYLDARRNLFAAAGTVTFPTTGYGLTFPRLTQRTLVGPRGAEKTQVPSRALTTDTVSYPIEWFAGAVDVALELIAQSDPGVLAVVWADMLDQYAIATETAFVAKSEAAAGTSAGALDFSDYGTFVKAVVQASVAIRTATGVPGDLLALTTPSWVELLSIVDGDTRRILATSGQTNGDGSALFTAEAVNVGGINCFHSPASTKDLQFNTKSLRKGEKPSMQLTSDNVALMGRDVGILGATIAVPLYPGGIVAHAPAARAR